MQDTSRCSQRSVLVTAAVGSFQAQSGRGSSQAAPAAAFEVASVKANKSNDGRVMMGLQPGGRLTFTNVPLRLMIRNAFQVQDSQIVGGPAWLDSDRFDVLAKAEGNPDQEQTRAMLRTLLADRFKLVVHSETRDVPTYALVIARSDGRLGPKLTRSEAACGGLRGGPPPGPPPGSSPGPSASAGRGGQAPPCGMRFGPGSLNAQGASLAMLAQTLSNQLGRVVRDKTGLTDTFDFTLEFAPKVAALGRGQARAPPMQIGRPMGSRSSPRSRNSSGSSSTPNARRWTSS